MAKKGSNVGVILIGLILLAVIAVGYYTDWTFKFEAVPPTGVPPAEVPVGTYTMRCNAYDTLDVATSRTVGTDVNIYWYAYRSGAWVLLGSGDNVNIELQEGDQGYIYVVCTTSASYYLDWSKTKSMNSRVKTVSYEDVDKDNVKDWVFKWSMFDIPPAASGYPTTTFYAYALTYDGSFAFPSGGQPADITGFGATTVTKYIAWYMSASAEKKGVAVWKIELKVNSTSTTTWKLKNVNVPGVGYLDASNFEEQILENYVTYTYKIGSNLYDCVYWQLPPNVNNKFDLTTGIEFTNPSADGWTLTIYQLNPSGTSVTDADECGITA